MYNQFYRSHNSPQLQRENLIRIPIRQDSITKMTLTWNAYNIDHYTVNQLEAELNGEDPEREENPSCDHCDDCDNGDGCENCEDCVQREPDNDLPFKEWCAVEAEAGMQNCLLSHYPNPGRFTVAIQPEHHDYEVMEMFFRYSQILADKGVEDLTVSQGDNDSQLVVEFEWSSIPLHRERLERERGWMLKDEAQEA
jgi:hypothetical protein